MRKVLFILFIGFSINISAQEYLKLFNEAMNCYFNKDYDCTISKFESSLKLQPNNYTAKYNLACAYALKGNTNQSVSLLNEIIPHGFGFNAENDADFDLIRNTPEFKQTIQNINAAKTPINNSEIEFVIDEKDLIPENIAYNSLSKKFYVGSIYKSKIIEIDEQGNYNDFINENEYGITSIIGMKIDSKNNILWVCSSNGRQTKDYNNSSENISGLFSFDLSSGNLVEKYLLNNDSVKHFLNDLVITNAGDIYLSDSNFPAVYKLNRVENKLEIFKKFDGLMNLNGITISDDQRYLFVAHFSGIKIIDLNSGISFDLKSEKDIYTGIIDGLYFYKNSLIAVQNSRIMKFNLSDDLLSITNNQILEANNPEFNIPTTGVIVKDNFHYIANSQLGSFSAPGRIFPDEKLEKVKIMKMKL